MNDEMNIMNDNWKMEEMKHERRYESEIEYRAVRAYEKGNCTWKRGDE